MTDEIVTKLFQNAAIGAEASAAMERIAKIIGVFYRTLINEGFTEDQAFNLCQYWLTYFMIGQHRC